MMDLKKKIKEPSIWYSVFIMIMVIIIIMSGILIFEATIELMLLIALMVTIPFILYLGYSYKELQEAMLSMMAKALVPAMIVLVVGAMIGAWLISGTVPTLIYYGIQTISPGYFFVTAFVLFASWFVFSCFFCVFFCFFFFFLVCFCVLLFACPAGLPGGGWVPSVSLCCSSATVLTFLWLLLPSGNASVSPPFLF